MESLAQDRIAPQICALEASHCFAIYDRVLLTIWRLEVTAEAVTDMRRIGKRLVADARGPVCILSVIEQTSPAPGEKLRAAISAFYRELASSTKQQIILPEGSGFRVAMVRSVGVALSAIARGSLPFKFVSSVEEAAALISPHLSPSAGGAAGLLSAIDNVRAQMR